jgi:hypothetical protein
MKRKPDSGIGLMARGASFERAAWLANMLRMADGKEIADPTDDDIQEMREAVGDDPTFEKLLDSNKTLLFCAMLTIRQRLQIYDELVKFEEEEPGPLLSALTGMVATIPNYHGLLSVAADEMAEIGRTTVHEAWRKIIECANTEKLLLEIIQRVSAEPNVYDKRTVRSRRQRHEALMIRDCLKVIGVDLRKTGPDEYGREGDPGLKLAVRIVRYTSGENVELDAFRTRLYRARRQFRGNRGP